MKILVALSSTFNLIYLANLLEELKDRGHEVVVHARKTYKTKSLIFQSDFYEFERKNRENYNLIEFDNYWSVNYLKKICIKGLRALKSYAVYLNPKHTSQWRIEGVKKRMRGTGLARIAYNSVFDSILKIKSVLKIIDFIESIIPPDKTISDIVKNIRPDVVISAPFIFHEDFEIEYAKTAKKLRIKTVVPLLSWDFLSTKYTFPFYPDKILVWNHDILREAVDIHYVPREIIEITGATRFDKWFSLRPKMPRQDFLTKLGIPDNHKYLVYLCSSNNISKDEKDQIIDIQNILLGEKNICGLSLVVRPHPLNTLTDVKRLNGNGLAVWPRHRNFPYSDQSIQDYFDTLFHSEGVIGVNTSAFLESAIVDRPCITLLSDRYEQTQTKMGHFNLLMKQNFIETASSTSELKKTVVAVLSGDDRKKGARRSFVKNFLRPQGINRSSSSFTANVIENLICAEE